MTIHTTKVTRKGQITIPVSIREALNIHEGDLLVAQRRENEIVLVRQQDVVDWTAGALSEFARGIPDPAQERAQFEQDLADEVYERYKSL